MPRGRLRAWRGHTAEGRQDPASVRTKSRPPECEAARHPHERRSSKTPRSPSMHGAPSTSFCENMQFSLWPEPMGTVITTILQMGRLRHRA